MEMPPSAFGISPRRQAGGEREGERGEGGRPLRFEGVEDGLEDGVEVLEDLVVSEAEDLIAVLVEELVAALVVGWIFEVL